MNHYGAYRQGEWPLQKAPAWLYGGSPLIPAWPPLSTYPLDHGFVPASHSGNEAEAKIPPTEDLMREHGVLNRLLLVYEEGVRRILAGKDDVSPGAIQRSAQLIREFVQDYHEHLEEQWLFPRFERAGRFVDLVKLLTLQHDRGRLLTDLILNLSTPQAMTDPEQRLRLAQACTLFSRMYRPHEAREDTVLFPAVRSIMSADEFAALGEQFEREETKRFGAGGFERIVHAVAQMEKEMGIHDLAQFTP